MENKNKTKGFTLIELAIVLMIIGLLIGGILRGQELLQNARITSTIQQVKAYQGALTTFRDAYTSIPGDMTNASARLAGCQTGNTNSCGNGNGDGLVTSPANSRNEPVDPIDPAIGSENTQFWKHMALVHLISGVNPAASTPDWGQTHPISKFSGGFFIRSALINAPPRYWSGLAIVMRQSISGNPNTCPNTNGFCTISPMYASIIDRKMDDGIALTGDVWGVGSGWTTGCGYQSYPSTGPGGYAETNNTALCDMAFRIN